MTMASQLFAVTIFVAVAGCASSSEKLNQMAITFSPPSDEDAIPLEEKFESKESAREKLGEPTRTKALTSSDVSPCTERWFYSAKADIAGLGPIDLLTYVDFDINGKSCELRKP